MAETQLTSLQLTNDQIEGANNSNMVSLSYVLFWAVILGLMMNWLASYLKISMGFVSVGIGPMAVLLIGRQILKRKQASTRKNLVTIIIAYGATQAAEASVGILFLLWLATNSSFFGGLSFDPPWWLLPSNEVITSRTLLSVEWVTPLLVHYFLMLVPGILGIIFGWFMKDSFIHNDEAYPFPGMISQNSQVGVLTDEAETRGPIFWKIVRYGFFGALLTILIPGLFVIDLSNVSAGFIFGIMLGPVGLALFAAGILIGKPKVSITPFFSSVLAYSILGMVLVTNRPDTDFFGYFNFLLQEYYFVPTLGIMLGGIILGPIVWSVLQGLLSKKKANGEESNDEEDGKEQDEELDVEKTGGKASLLGLLRSNYKLLLAFTAIYLVMVFYVQSLNILPAAPLWVIAILLFWNIILGGIVNGYLVTAGVAKSNSALAPPFVFDVIPIFLAGGAGLTAYVAMPTAETDGSAGIVSSQKLAQMNDLTKSTALKAYITGYVATSLTTPLFALMMWKAFGIGTTAFPAPAFPVQGAILASFASRDVTSIIDPQIFVISLLVAILLARLGQDLMFGLIIGLLFPPHMAVPMALGGLLRMFMDRRYDDEVAKDKAATWGPALAVGSSFVIPIMILLAFLA